MKEEEKKNQMGEVLFCHVGNCSIFSLVIILDFEISLNGTIIPELGKKITFLFLYNVTNLSL